MKRDITRILRKHIGQLDSMMQEYGAVNRETLIKAAETHLVFETQLAPPEPLTQHHFS